MNVATKLGAFALALGVVFAGAYGVGALAGPAGTEPGPVPHDDGGGHEPSAAGPGGLAVSADGYTLRRVDTASGEFAFRIVDAHGAPVTRLQVSHDKQLHLIVVRRDLSGFQHLHPTRSPDGTWRTPLRLPEAGDWRVFADFRPEGLDRQVILGLDVPVAGTYQPHALPAPASTATVDDYLITVDGHLVPGRTSRLTLTVSRGGVPVADLQPYLGAYGHLVALRAGDLGYLHVHPLETGAAGPAITFDVEVPTAGAYRLFLDFQHGGVTRTASFTAEAAS
jgi:hypothetical protein